MRKIAFLLLSLAVALVAPPSVAAQARLDIGAIVPRGAGVASGGSSTSVGTFVDNWPFIPLPDAGIYYQGDLGLLKLGIGARATTFILETIAWPNAYAELDLGPVAIQAQVGGGAFLMLGLVTSPVLGKVLIPDISAWYKFGKKGIFRLGAGAIGLYVPDAFGDFTPFLIYIGGKASIML